MLSARVAIVRFRRDVLIGRAAWVLLFFVGFLALRFGAGDTEQGWFAGAGGVLLLGSVVGFLFFQGYRDLKNSRQAADWPALIATGRFEQAERQIDLSLRTFSLYRRVKLLSLHNLAMLRHAQQRWDEAVMLCRAVLDQQVAMARALSKPSRLLLADSLLQVGDLSGAYEALSRLYQQRLSLAEAMTLLQLQLDYSWRVGAYDAMVSGLPAKVQLAELMPSASAARTQTYLALAAYRMGQPDVGAWLGRRVKLLVDPQAFAAEMPVAMELWKRMET
jgi:tetratricopeptide (TPR) repeat protein